MSPSDRQMRRFLNFDQKSAHSSSARAVTDITGVNVSITVAGESVMVGGIRDDDPICTQRTVPSSSQAAKSGSQAPEWTLGIPSASGFSEKATAWHPLAARRCTSL